MSGWFCRKCRREFTRRNQRHACGTGGSNVVRGRPERLATLYRKLEAFAKSLGPIELVTRDRCVFVASSNEGAVRLWSKLGFETVGRLPKAFRHPQLGFVDALVLYKWLE